MGINYDKVFLGESTLSTEERKKMDKDVFGLPKTKKYPLNDKNHIIKAVQFFHYCPEDDKEELANNIIKRAKELDVKVINHEVLKYIK